MSRKSLFDYIDRQAAARDEAVRSREEAVDRAQRAADQFELEKGRRPGFELPQKGLQTEWDLWNAEKAVEERAARDREHDRELVKRRSETESGIAEMRRARAELSARIRATRPAPTKWPGSKGELRSR